MKKIAYIISLVLVVAVVFSGCRTSKKNGKLKKGKPAPCPIYDC